MIGPVILPTYILEQPSGGGKRHQQGLGATDQPPELRELCSRHKKHEARIRKIQQDPEAQYDRELKSICEEIAHKASTKCRSPVETLRKLDHARGGALSHGEVLGFFRGINLPDNSS